MEYKNNTSIETNSGTIVDIANPNPDTINIPDVAHALSNQCRYGGHCRKFYSVAEHSVLVAMRVKEQTGDFDEALWGILHDASEAYLVDIPTPVKPLLGNYYQMEKKFQNIFAEMFDLPETMPDSIKEADAFMLAQEAHKLIPSRGATWVSCAAYNNKPHPSRFAPKNLKPAAAKHFFMYYFYHLMVMSSRAYEYGTDSEYKLKSLKHWALYLIRRILP